MSQSFEQFMLRAWYEGRGWLKLLRPLSLLYRTAAVSRRRRYLNDPKASWQPPVPLIVVGNITLGGTGKTPMTLWLIEHFQRSGLRVGVVSRGYGATPPSLPWLVKPAADSPAHVGDEPLLVARRSGVPVVIDPDRSRAAQHLLDRHEIDLIISDDGLQHYRMGRTLELVLIDAVRGLGNARCLPEGPLREPAERLDSVDFVIRNGAESDQAGSFAMRLRPAALVNLVTGERCAVSDWPHARDVSAVAGIGNPKRFFDTLRSLSFRPAEYAFGDHAAYNADSFAGVNAALPLIMTEKDAIKCLSFAQPGWWYLAVDAELSDAFARALDARLSHPVGHKQ